MSKEFDFFNKEEYSDAGSSLGRFWTRKVGLKQADLYVRSTIGVLLLIAFIPLMLHVDNIQYAKEEADDARIERMHVYN